MTSGQRIDSVNRIINASAEAIFGAFADSKAWETWLPPDDMTGRMQKFDFREGGSYEMTLTYSQPEVNAKSGNDSDVSHGSFVEIVPNSRVVQDVEFQSDDSRFAGTMRMIWQLDAEASGTRVTFSATDVPEGINADDHIAGMTSTLENLATYVEPRS